MSWKRERGLSKKPIAVFGALLRCAIDTGLVARRATSGWIDGGEPGQQVWRIERVDPGIAHGLRLVRWSRRSSRLDASMTTSGRRRSGGTCRRIGRSLALPSRQTMHNILVRHDLVPRRRRRVRRWHPGRPDTNASEPNGTWTADFKGEFPMGDGELCYPLTVQDMHSRFVLECWGRPDVTIDGVIPVFTRLFRQHGLPERIRTDNGTPFASNALGRLSRLSVWFIQVGILPELIEPGCPQQNGKHENMHLVLKRRTTRPPSSNMRTQQQAFRRFRKLYNEVRPHEALDGAVPSNLYRPSPRPFPKQLDPVTYPGHFETRLVSTNGGIRWYGDRVPVGRLFAGHEVGLEEIDHGLFEVYFGPIWLGRFVEPKRLIFDSLGRGKRRTGGTCKGRRTVTQVS